jgi:hypothetical protein
MAVTYTQQQKKAARDDKLHLVTVAAAGLEAQLAVSEEERDEVLRFALELLGRQRRKASKAPGADAGGGS